MSALTLGAGRTVNFGFRLFLGILANLPVTLAFGSLFFVIFFWWAWWTRRRFARNWWLDTCLKFVFCHLWPITIFVFGFLAFKDLSQTRFVEERPRPDDVAKSLQASLETMVPYWLGVIANTGTDPALTAAVTPVGEANPLAQVPIPSAFLDRLEAETVRFYNEKQARRNGNGKSDTFPEEEMRTLGASSHVRTSSPTLQPFSGGIGGLGRPVVAPVLDRNNPLHPDYQH